MVNSGSSALYLAVELLALEPGVHAAHRLLRAVPRGVRRTAHRAGDRDGLANADRVMETGLMLPCNHAIDDEGIECVRHHGREFLERVA
jgi:hypothetical protein